LLLHVKLPSHATSTIPPTERSYSCGSPSPAGSALQNSWGGGWGEQGYFRLATKSSEKAGACGILQAASYPLKKGATNPEVPTFCGFFGWTECPVRSACVCNFDLFGLLCLNWGCQAS
jgi:hypothetical protein